DGRSESADLPGEALDLPRNELVVARAARPQMAGQAAGAHREVERGPRQELPEEERDHQAHRPAHGQAHVERMPLERDERGRPASEGLPEGPTRHGRSVSILRPCRAPTRREAQSTRDGNPRALRSVIAAGTTNDRTRRTTHESNATTSAGGDH